MESGRISQLEQLSSVSNSNAYEVNGEFLIIKDKSKDAYSNTLKAIYRLSDGQPVSDYPFAGKCIVSLNNGLLILKYFFGECTAFPSTSGVILLNLNNGNSRIEPEGSLCCVDENRCAILGDAQINIYDLETHDPVACIKLPSINVRALDLSKRLLLFLYHENGEDFVDIWDINFEEWIQTISLEEFGGNHTILKYCRKPGTLNRRQGFLCLCVRQTSCKKNPQYEHGFF